MEKEDLTITFYRDGAVETNTKEPIADTAALILAATFIARKHKTTPLHVTKLLLSLASVDEIQYFATEAQFRFERTIDPCGGWIDPVESINEIEKLIAKLKAM